MFRQTHSHPEHWRSYLSSIQRDHCPYVAKSLRNEVLTISEYSLADVKNPEEYAFALGVVHAEILLAVRSRAFTEEIGKLTCENISFADINLEPVQQEHFFQWMHWGLKLRYTDFGIVFGKFWPAERFIGHRGKPVPSPPQMLLSVRSTIGERDAKFFNISPTLADRHKKALTANPILPVQSESRAIDRLRTVIFRGGTESLQREQVTDLAFEIAQEAHLAATISKDAFLSMHFTPEAPT